MKRRSFLKYTASFIAFPSLPKTKNFGWIVNEGIDGKSLYDISFLRNYGANKIACLWKAYSIVRKQQWIPHQQVGGDCVAQSAGSCIDILTCCRIALERKREKFIAESSTNLIYSGGRNEIPHRWLRGPGMEGSWAVKWLKEYGNLLRIEYPPYDLRPYNKQTLNYWDKNGVPESLKIEAKKHQIINYISVRSFAEIRDAVCSGHPVVFTSNIGVENDRRDDDGFVRPSGWWAHAWMIAGVQDDRRPGVCLINSHGASFGKGPKAFDQPDGSVWIDAKYIDQSLKRFSDSYALTDYHGFIAPERNYNLW